MLLTEILMKIVQFEMVINCHSCKRRFKNLVKYLIWSFCENSYAINYFHKTPVLDFDKLLNTPFNLINCNQRGLSNDLNKGFISDFRIGKMAIQIKGCVCI